MNLFACSVVCVRLVGAREQSERVTERRSRSASCKPPLVNTKRTHYSHC